MKFWKRLLGLLLVLGVVFGVVWGVGEIRELGDKKEIEGQEGQEVAEKPIKFAVMGDIHSDWENFRKALGKAKTDMGIGDFGGVGGFVVITGDLTTLGKKSELLEAKKILDESGLKYYVIPGNHDLWWGSKYKKDVWREVFGESYQSFKIEETKFILVNNGGIEGVEGYGGKKGNQAVWLKKETEECPKIYCLVFLHMPLNHPTSLHVMGEGNTSVAGEAGRIREMLVRKGVKEIFAGHLHFSSSYELDGLKTTIVGAVVSERNFQSPKFLEIEMWDEELRKKEVFVQ